MRPILFTLFGFPVRAYGTFIAVAFLAGMWLAERIAAKRRPEHVPLIETFVTYAMFAGIIGARIWEVAFTWGYYGKHLAEIPAIWHGGLSIQGGVVGGALVAVWLVRKHKISFWDFADSLVPGVLLGQAIGRIGSCFLNGDAYGKPTGTSFGVIYQPGTAAYDTFGAVRLWPAELFEGIWDLIIMVFAIWMLREGRKAGTVTLWYIILYSAGRFSLELLRADSLMIAGMKAAQLTSLIFIVMAGALLLYWRRKDGDLETQQGA